MEHYILETRKEMSTLSKSVSMKTDSSKTVCVIGGGSSGLVVMKELISAGFDTSNCARINS